MKCSNMNCEQVDYKCRPEYCSNNKDGASKSWGYCNMLHWKNIKNSPNYHRFIQLCLKDRKENNQTKKYIRKKKHTISVNAELLHHKMPYIWRFLKPKTRRKMIELAKEPLQKINIPFMVFTKKRKTSKEIQKLRKKFKDI